MNETIANYLALLFYEIGREDLAAEVLELADIQPSPYLVQ